MMLEGDRLTEKDLIWWLETAVTLDWTFAKTYADSDPHHYVVRGKTFNEEDFLRAVRVIRTFGEPGKFYDRTNIYLTDPVTQTKWWTMGADISETVIINKASTSEEYGVQDAPSTATEDFTVYDSLATVYDQRYDEDHCHECIEENALVWKIVAGHFEDRLPTILDIGCGTGLVMDLKLTSPDKYVGLDPSQGMLNEFVRKYPAVSRLYPMTAEQFLASNTLTEPVECVVSLFGSPSYIDPNVISRLPDLTSDLLVLMHYEPGYLPDYHLGTPPNIDTSRKAAHMLLDDYPGYHTRIGKFHVTVISKKG